MFLLIIIAICVTFLIFIVGIIYVIFEYTRKNEKPLEINHKEIIEFQEFDKYIMEKKKFKWIAVYFANAFVNPTHIVSLMKDQLPESLINDFDEFYIALSAPADFIVPDFISQNKKIILYVNNQSIHEYPGIHLLWELGQKNEDNTVLLYYHSKGITHINTDEKYKRNEFEKNLFNQVIINKSKYMNYFLLNNNLKRCGYSVSIKGCIWHNYYFIKNDYLKKKEEPVITEDRYYYEHWSGSGTYKDALSLEKPNYWFDADHGIYNPY